jgi:hypothetical protein
MPSKGNKKKHSQHMLCKIHGELVDWRIRKESGRAWFRFKHI